MKSYTSVMKNIILIVSPIILSSFLYNVNTYLNSRIYSQISGFKGLDSSLIEGLYAECGYFYDFDQYPADSCQHGRLLLCCLRFSGAYAIGKYHRSQGKDR